MMTDVFYLLLCFDDLLLLYWVYFFVMMVKLITGANVVELELDITRR